MRRQFWRSFRQNTSGATAAMFAIALPVLIAVIGIGFDYAHLAAMDTELQNAADESALSGVTQLDAQSGAMSRAVKAVQGDLVTNLTKFANDKSANSSSTDPEAVGIPSANIFFYATKADAEAGTGALDQNDPTTNDPKARFIKVVVETRTARYALTPVVGALYGAKINAAAIAGLGSATCRTPPMMICNPDEPVGNDNPNYPVDFTNSLKTGDGLLVVQGAGSSWTPGNFGYLDTGLGANAQGVKKGLGWDNPGGQCIATYGGVDTVDTATGVKTTVTDAINTRFDIYDTQACINGDSNCSPSINTHKDVVRNSDASSCGYSNSSSSGNSGWYLPDKPYAPTSATAPLTLAQEQNVDSMGLPRDICHAFSVDGSCPNGPVGNGNWDRDAYFYVNYVRSDGTHWSQSDWINNLNTYNTDPGNTDNNTNNLFGGKTFSATSSPQVLPTRYEVYKWEIAHRGYTIDGVKILDPRSLTPGTTPAPISENQPVCSGNPGVVPGVSTPDRRRISVAVVNCYGGVPGGVSGKTTGVPVQAWMDVFLVQPSLDRGTGTGQRTRKQQVYMEIIGQTKAGGNGETAGSVIRRDQPYLVK